MQTLLIFAKGNLHTRRTDGTVEMNADPIVQRIRNVRHEIEAEYDNDDAKYYRHLKSLQKKYGKRLVCRHPVPRIKTKSA